MLSVSRTLSLRYLAQRWPRVLLIVLSIALGVATLLATRALDQTMVKAAGNVANPLAGIADLMVGRDQGSLDASLAPEILKVQGVRTAQPLLVEKIELVEVPRRQVTLLGFDLRAEGAAAAFEDVEISPETQEAFKKAYAVALIGLGPRPVVVGKELYEVLQQLPDKGKLLHVRTSGKPAVVTCCGPVDGRGVKSVLGGYVLFMDLRDANASLHAPPLQATRIDVTVRPDADLATVRHRLNHHLQLQSEQEKTTARVAALLAAAPTSGMPGGVAWGQLAALPTGSPPEVWTPSERNQSFQQVISALQTGSMLCGFGALIVGLFLVYNTLSVSVAERRHEIGVLRSLGATRLQVRLLFAGEALLMGVAGAGIGLIFGHILAQMSLRPVNRALSGIYFPVDAQQVEMTPDTLLIASLAGIVTALLAALVPAWQASLENPAEAVRRMPKMPTWRHRFLQIGTSLLFLFVGLLLILERERLPAKVGTFGGLMTVLLGSLLAAPTVAALVARLMIQPVARMFWGIEARLAADNLVRSPARTGLVIAALGAGVTLVLQTAGLIKSNRHALREWMRDTGAADVVITSGSPISTSGQTRLMERGLGADLMKQLGDKLPEMQAILPVREDHVRFRHTQIHLVALDARAFYELDEGREHPVSDLAQYAKLATKPGGVLVSDNFAALHRVSVGDTVTVASLTLPVLGKVVDYSWNHGTVFLDLAEFRQVSQKADRDQVSSFEVYLRQPISEGAVEKVRQALRERLGKEFEVHTRAEIQEQVDAVIENLYSVAYSQEVVVGIVAALGVVTSLLISVLQRRREMGTLRAIGASRVQVIRSVLAEAGLMGVIGTALGLAVGIPLEWYVLNVVFLDEAGYLFPVIVPWAEAGIIAAAALGMATLAGLLPALSAVRQRIPEAIAYE
jgi:putative ABC transport system permease protein